LNITGKKMRKTPLAVLIASALLSLDATALDLMSAYRDAQAYDSQFSSARAAREANSEKSVQGRAGLLPSASMTGSVNKVNGESTINPNINYTANAYQLQLRQPLYNRANADLYEQSKLQVAVSEVQFDQAKSDLMVRVAQAYFDVLATQDTIAFIQAQRVAIAEQLASAKRNFEVGTATITDTHEAQARFDLSNAQEIAAINDLEVKRNAFAQITGKLPPSLSGLKAGLKLSPPEPVSMDPWVQNAESGNFGVVAQGLLAEIAKLDISRNRAGHLPTVDAVATYGSNTSVFTTAITTTTTNIGVQLTIPLFSGYATSSKIREAISLEDKARADLDTIRRNAAQSTRAAFLGVLSGLSQIRALEAAEISSKSALDSNRLGYEVGVRINIDVLNAQQQLYSTRRDLAKARYDTLMNSLRLKAAAGMLSEADLTQFNELFERKQP
jgi:outer membrane protein